MTRILEFNKAPGLADDVESYKRRTVVALRSARLFDIEEDISIDEGSSNKLVGRIGEHFSVLRTSHIPLTTRRIRLTIHVWVMFEEGLHERTLVTVKLGSSTVLSQKIHAWNHDSFLRDIQKLQSIIIKYVTAQYTVASEFTEAFNCGKPTGDTNKAAELYTKLINSKETK